MTEILKALDAITSRVLAYRPKEKGVAATKMRKQIEKAEREAKREEGSELYNSHFPCVARGPESCGQPALLLRRIVRRAIQVSAEQLTLKGC